VSTASRSDVGAWPISRSRSPEVTLRLAAGDAEVGADQPLGIRAGEPGTDQDLLQLGGRHLGAGDRAARGLGNGGGELGEGEGRAAELVVAAGRVRIEQRDGRCGRTDDAVLEVGAILCRCCKLVALLLALFGWVVANADEIVGDRDRA
jgi:hypothetical protein